MTTNPTYEPPPDGSTNPIATVQAAQIAALEAERDALRAALDTEREAVRILAALCREWNSADNSLDECPWAWSTIKAIERAEDAVDANPIAAAAVKGKPNGEA